MEKWRQAKTAERGLYLESTGIIVQKNRRRGNKGTSAKAAESYSKARPPGSDCCKNKGNRCHQQVAPGAAAGQQKEAAGEGNNYITIDDFTKIELRIGTITAAEKVEKADKLLKLQIDLGYETRTILSGIALHFKPEEIIGRQVTVVANLAPRKMRGIESNGMILMAEDKTGKLHFVSPDTMIDAGSRVSINIIRYYILEIRIKKPQRLCCGFIYAFLA